MCGDEQSDRFNHFPAQARGKREAEGGAVGYTVHAVIQLWIAWKQQMWSVEAIRFGSSCHDPPLVR